MTNPTSPVPSTFCTYIRGGTSKALFFHERDIPPAGPKRDKYLIRIMGSPDPNQIDGMGGTRIVTSKVAIIRPSKRRDADVDYTFAQIGLGESKVTYDSNCGNISSGVGPFAINEGLLSSDNWDGDDRLVRIYNTGKGVVLIAHVPVDRTTGRAIEKGEFAISGCPGTGAPITMDYSQTARADHLLPTGHVIDTLDCTFGKVEATFTDVGNPFCFIDAASINARGDESADAINNDGALIGRLKEVRGRIAQKVGKCSDWQRVDEQSPMVPMVAFISKPTSAEGHIQSRLILDNRCHQSMAGTGGIGHTAISRVQGSVINRLLDSDALADKVFRIQHPAGHLPVQVGVDSKSEDPIHPAFAMLGFERTSRYIFQGQLFTPADIVDDVQEPLSTSSLTAGKAQDEQAVHHSASTMPQDASAEQGSDVTKQLVRFVHDVKFADLSSDALQRLRQCLVDFIGVAELGVRTGESTAHFLAGIDAVVGKSPGTHTVIGTKKRYPVQYAALLNGAFAHTPDFDDTHTGGIIHVGATVIAATLAEAESHPDLNFEDFVLALGIGYEVAVRVAIALGVSSWHRGFHNTSIAGIYGAVACISRLRGLSTDEMENAFGLAVSFASGSMQYLENGSWNKRLHPGKAAHDAFLVVAMAQAGVLGAAKPLEGKFGLVAAHTDPPRTRIPVDGLGKRWELINTGLKPYPACRVTHTSIEMAATMAQAPYDLAEQTKLNRGREVKRMTITMDPACYPIVGVPQPNKVHPADIVDAQFSVYYQAALAWVYGDKLGWKAYDHISDQKVQELCGKITVESRIQGDSDLITSMVVEFEDGGMEDMTLLRPKWQQPERPPRDEEVVDKFDSLARDSLGDARSAQVVDFVMGGKLDAPVKELVEALALRV